MLHFFIYSLHAGGFTGFFGSLNVGGIFFHKKHTYEREDVNEKALKDFQKKYLDGKFPGIEKKRKAADKIIDSYKTKMKNAEGASLISEVEKAIRTIIIDQLIRNDNFNLFIKYPPEDIKLKEGAGLETTKIEYERWVRAELKAVTDSNSPAMNDFSKIKQERLGLIQPVWGTTTILNHVLTEATPKYPNIVALVNLYRPLNLNRNSPQIQGLKVQYAEAFALDVFIDRSKDEFQKVIESFDDPIEKAHEEYLKELKEKWTGEKYTPKDGKVKPLTSPLQSQDPLESTRWQKFEGVAKSSRPGYFYGAGVGYIKELNDKIVGGVFEVGRDNLEMNYSLLIKEKANNYGNLSAKPLVSLTIAGIAGKIMYPDLAVYLKTGVEATRWNFSYNVNNEVPSIKNKEKQTQNFGYFLFPILFGAGVMYNFRGWIICLEYNLLTFTGKTIRDFNKEGEDLRRRGYISSGMGHRLVLKVKKFVF